MEFKGKAMLTFCGSNIYTDALYPASKKKIATAPAL
jgi:hypothetical protein